MDTLSKAKKLQAMKSYKAHQFLHHLIIDLVILIVLAFSLLCFFPNWLPSLLYSPIKEVVFLSLPNSYYSFIFSPKWLFIVVNVIVLFLLGESKLIGSNSLSPATEIYDEYVTTSRRHRGIPTLEEKALQNKLDMVSLDESRRVTVIQDEQVKEEVKEVINESSLVEEVQEEFHEVVLQEEAELLVQENKAQEEQIEVKEEVEVALLEDHKEGINKENAEREEENCWPIEELNRRVEEFIARVNRQRWLEESRLLVYCTA